MSSYNTTNWLETILSVWGFFPLKLSDGFIQITVRGPKGYIYQVLSNNNTKKIKMEWTNRCVGNHWTTFPNCGLYTGAETQNAACEKSYIVIINNC